MDKSNLSKISQARVVSCWWLVYTAKQVESEYGSPPRRLPFHHGNDMEAQRRPRVPIQDARTRSILPQQTVSQALSELHMVRLTRSSWSRQIIDYEKAQKDKGQSSWDQAWIDMYRSSMSVRKNSYDYKKWSKTFKRTNMWTAKQAIKTRPSLDRVSGLRKGYCTYEKLQQDTEWQKQVGITTV